MSVLDTLLDQLREEIDRNTDDLRDGEIDIDEWQARLSDSLVSYSIAGYLSNKPGETYTRKDKEVLARFLQFHIDKANAFADEIQDTWDEDDTAWKPRWESRASMYAGAIKTAEAKGRTVGIPLPFFPAEDTDCLTHCGCNWRIDVLDADEGTIDAYWERNKNDSCDTCIERENGNPYEIRDGVLT
jgi:hypothetical protein